MLFFTLMPLRLGNVRLNALPLLAPPLKSRKILRLRIAVNFAWRTSPFFICNQTFRFVRNFCCFARDNGSAAQNSCHASSEPQGLMAFTTRLANIA